MNTFFFAALNGKKIDVFATEHGSLWLKLLLCLQNKTFPHHGRILLGVLHHDGNLMVDPGISGIKTETWERTGKGKRGIRYEETVGWYSYLQSVVGWLWF